MYTYVHERSHGSSIEAANITIADEGRRKRLTNANGEYIIYSGASAFLALPYAVDLSMSEFLLSVNVRIHDVTIVFLEAGKYQIYAVL